METPAFITISNCMEKLGKKRGSKGLDQMKKVKGELNCDGDAA